MRKDEFLQGLREALQGMPPAEIDEALRYYEEFLADAGEENEEQVLREWGSPAALAAKIRADIAIRALQGQPTSAKNGISAVWLVLLAILASPIAIPIAAAVFAVAVVMVVVAFVLLVVFFVVAIALFAGGIGLWVISIGLLAFSGGSAILFLGGGLCCVGFALLFGILAVQLSRMSFRGIANMLDRMRQRGKENLR